MIYKAVYRELFNLHEAAETMTLDELTAAVIAFVDKHTDCPFACNVALEIVTDICERRGFK